MAGVITQPKSVKGPASAPNLFGAPPNNSNRQPIDNDNFMQTNDATLPDNLLSPQTATTTPLKLTTPQNATRITLIGAAAFQVSEDAAMTQFITVPANLPITIDVCRQDGVWINTAASTSAVSFFYQTL